MNNERYTRLGIAQSSELFSLVCIIDERNRTITRRTLGKESMGLEKINQTRSDAKNLDNSIALSFFRLTRKLGKQNNDMLIGMILYDLKKDEAIVFNIQSVTSFLPLHGVDKNEWLYDDVAMHFLKNQLTRTFYVLHLYHHHWTLHGIQHYPGYLIQLWLSY